MKIIVKTIFLLLLVINNNNIKAQDVYNQTIDSLLVSMSKLILEDITKDSVKVQARPWIGFGDSFELKVAFDSLHSEMLTSLNRPSDLNKKTSKWKLKRNIKLKTFMDYTYKHKDFPYVMFEYFNYKFLQVKLKDETFGDGMFGEFEFKASPEGLKIINKKIEILTGEKSILEKHNSVW